MAGGSFVCTFDPPIDLTAHDSTDESPLEDFITFFLRADFSNTANMRVTFYEDVDDRESQAWKRMGVADVQPNVSVAGLASILDVQHNVEGLLGRTDYAAQTNADELNDEIAPKDWIIPTDEWQYFVIPKRQFVRRGGFDWSVVEEFRVNLQGIADDGNVWISDPILVGGGKDDGGAVVTPPGGNGVATRGGMQGTYKYRITFLNDDTGNRSNPGDAIKVAENVNRGYVTLINLPTSPDPQVTHVEIWRTVGDGDRWFLIGRVPNGTATYEDQVADHDTLDSRDGVAVMTTIELPLDNDRPHDDFDNCIIDQLTAFWITNESGQQGRVFFSPIGRPESLKGFINVTQAGDHLHRLVVHQGSRYVFSETSLYQIDGSDPYVSRKIAGVPGVAFAQRRTAVSTPYGLVYQAQDGIRIFNNLQAQLVGFDAVGRLFRGETLEGIPAFEGIVAAYCRDEYFISDGQTCLAFSLAERSWRNVGFDDLTAIFYEWDTDTLVGGRTSNTQLLEVEGVVTDAGAAITLDWETPGVQEAGDRIMFLDRVFIDIDASGNTITPTVKHRFSDIALAAISDAARIAREFTVERLLLKPSVALTGDASTRVILYDVSLDIRNLVLGVVVMGRSERNAVAMQRNEIEGRYREGTGNGEIVFEVPGPEKQYDMTDRVFVLDRLTLEADTDSTDITPTIRMATFSFSLPVMNNATRGIQVYDIDRMGNLEEVILLGDFFTGLAVPTIWRVELHMRELELGMTVTTSGQRLSYPARAEVPSVGITFEIPPNRREFDNTGNLLWIERLVIDANTGGATITVEIETDGATFTVGTVSTTARDYTEIFVQRPGPIIELRLLGDFTADVNVFGVECHVRPVNLGIQTWRQNRFTFDGKVVAPASRIVFDVDPERHELDGVVNVPLIEWLYLEIDTAGSDVRPRIVTEFGDIVMTLANTDTRCTVVYDLHAVGNVHRVQLEGDFANNAIGLYGVECILGSLDLGLRLLEGGEGGAGG